MAWIEYAVRTGFQKLLCLSLPRAPSPELIKGTLLAWVEALEHGRTWSEEQDADRVAHAFRTLAATAKVWPSPSDLLTALPRRESRMAIARVVNKDAARERMAAARDELWPDVVCTSGNEASAGVGTENGAKT